MLYGLFIRIGAPLAFLANLSLCILPVGAKMTDASSKIDVRRLKMGDLLIKILIHRALLCLLFHVLSRS